MALLSNAGDHVVRDDWWTTVGGDLEKLAVAVAQALFRDLWLNLILVDMNKPKP